MDAARRGDRSSGRRRGVAAVEAAVALPLLLVLLMGIWEVARLVEVNQLVKNAAREAGRQASTGNKTSSEVQQDAVRYLQRAGINTAGYAFTIANLTGASSCDPTDAAQLDRYRIEISIPFDNVRWILLDRVTGATTISATSDWYSMNDIPVTVPNRLPTE